MNTAPRIPPHARWRSSCVGALGGTHLDAGACARKRQVVLDGVQVVHPLLGVGRPFRKEGGPVLTKRARGGDASRVGHGAAPTFKRDDDAVEAVADADKATRVGRRLVKVLRPVSRRGEGRQHCALQRTAAQAWPAQRQVGTWTTSTSRLEAEHGVQLHDLIGLPPQ